MTMVVTELKINSKLNELMQLAIMSNGIINSYMEDPNIKDRFQDSYCWKKLVKISDAISDTIGDLGVCLGCDISTQAFEASDIRTQRINPLSKPKGKIEDN